MKVTKLKSGNYNVRVFSHMENGKRIYKSFTAKHKYELYNLVYEFKAQKSPRRQTVGEMVDNYIELKTLLSPTTLSGYDKIRRTAFQDLMKEDAESIDDVKMQEYINKECQRVGRRGVVSPKTVRNSYGLIESAFKKMLGKSFDVTLPRTKPKLKEYPEIAKVYEAVKGSDIELPCMLALWLSFSMSEIRGLTYDSIRNGYIHIDKVKVDVGTQPVVKENAKVDTRNRKLKLPDEILQLIKETDAWKNKDGFLVTQSSKTINTKFKKLLAAQGITGFSFHSLRHLNASMMLSLGINERYAMERGGWKSPHTMRTVYQHTFNSEREIVDEKIDSYMKCIIDMHHDVS